MIAALLICSSPAFAENCLYLNDANDRLTFVDNGQNTVTIDRSGGRKLLCTWAITPDGPDDADIACDDGTRAGYFFSPDALGATNQNLLVFDDVVWFRRCD